MAVLKLNVYLTLARIFRHGMIMAVIYWVSMPYPSRNANNPHKTIRKPRRESLQDFSECNNAA